MRVVALAGGVGGAKLVDGLAKCLPPENLHVIVNTGDDFTHFGLKICPDLDTVCYTLAGMANPGTGWGHSGDQWNVMEALRKLDAPTWFQLGDYDLATHLERTRRLLEGQTLSQIVADFCRSWGILVNVIPMSNDPVSTRIVLQDGGELDFQEYFVRNQCVPALRAIHFKGADAALPAPGVLDAIRSADAGVICPSNPWVSINPILAIKGIREALAEKKVLAVSPIIAGQAVKGPAAKMYSEMGIAPSASAVAQTYLGLVNGFVLDNADTDQVNKIARWGIIPSATNILMVDSNDRQRLAHEILEFCTQI